MKVWFNIKRLFIKLHKKSTFVKISSKELEKRRIKVYKRLID